MQAESDYVLGITAFWQGRLEAARVHFAAAGSATLTDRRRPHLARYGMDPQVICLGRLANTLCLMAEVAAAERVRADALALAERVGHANTKATALVFAAIMAIELADTERLRDFVGALEASRQDALQNRVSTNVLGAYVRVLDGDREPGLAAIRAVLTDPAGAGHAPGMRALYLRVLLAATEAVGDVRGRLAAADDLLRPDHAARLWDAEAHRARAESLARLGAPAGGVEDALARAIAVARSQGAALLERRAQQTRDRFQRMRSATATPAADG